MKKNKILCFIIFILISLFAINTNISLAVNTENLQDTEKVEKSTTSNSENDKEDGNKQNKISDGIYVIKSALNESLCLDVSQALSSDCANIQLFEYVKENQQKFQVKNMNNGYYTITALHSGKLLDVANADKKPGTNVWQYGANNSDAQKWLIKATEDGTYNIISKCNGLYLNVDSKPENVKNGTNIEVNTKDGSKNQEFIFEEIKPLVGKQTIKDGTYEIRTALNEKYVLDVNQALNSDGANIQLFEYVKENQQKFKVKYVGNGYYTITALHSKKVLDVANASKTPGTNVWQYGANNSDAQKWIIQETEDGYYNMISKCNELYLNVAGKTAKNSVNIEVNEESKTNAQKFKFVKASEVNGKTIIGEKTIADGVYAIKSVLNEKYVLDVNQASKSDCANIQLFEYVEENQQKFYVKYIGNGNYTLTIIHSGKVLDVANAGTTSGTNVWQYASNNSDAQKWIIKKADDGSYYIISKCNELYLDVTNAIAKNGSNIQVYEGNQSKAQKFKFETVKISCEEGTYGKSGLAVKGDSRGTDLVYYKFGQGKNVLFTTFSIHGFEDSYDHDGKELTYIANEFKEYLSEKSDISLYNNWTIYIFPVLNPDGQTYGTTNNGAGRTTLYSAAPNHKGIDMNRNFQTTDYTKYTDSRNYNGTAAFQAYEAKYLREFLLNNKSQNGQTILIDLHGWLSETMGDDGLGKYYRDEFNLTKHISTYGRGYLINWARMSLGNSSKVARTALIELPEVKSHEEVVNNKYAEKYIDATINMLKSIK